MINFSYQDKLMENRFFKEKKIKDMLFSIYFIFMVITKPDLL